eukprot:CAMPEP_0175839018 /NCGR_PEP_ID=MMETSP0107_2-20121207/18575_1 /TAXON_ID=195067 ORGANISM="Goniomonas pacifica, Strain CCMP1869" /NCGR_SAMPLE_ID=MMETSP0107_2 /ASSEMBLY_ACC=CAM_ASM_000203 /LENGTH=35 /DNA_ID= /DNA_START= /DNA_END= /DNA_ORIENTATION=
MNKRPLDLAVGNGHVEVAQTPLSASAGGGGAVLEG